MTTFFESRRAAFQNKAASLGKKYKSIALVRILVFLFGIAFSVYLVHLRLGVAASIAFTATFVAFGILVYYHRRIKDAHLHHELLARVNKEEINRLNLTLDGFDQGTEFAEEEHPYAYDLDIFGRHSLFQLLNRTGTPKGKMLLAQSLKTHASPDEIAARQAAVAELRNQTNWRQDFQVRPRVSKAPEGAANDWVLQWLRRAENLVHPWAIYFTFLLWGAFAAVLLLVFSSQISFYWLFAFNVISTLAILPRAKKLGEFAENMAKANALLSAYSKLLKDIESHSFQSPYLADLRARLLAVQTAPSQVIRKLNGITDHLENRRNLFYIILNAFLMLDIFLIGSAERWKSKFGHLLEDWLDIIAEFEVIASMAAFAQANPDYSFPKISEENHHFSASALGHPLIRKDKCVANDFSLYGKGSIALITGSNMAGKSTFLRTAGLNLVLAQAGCPVYAAAMVFSPCDVFSSMRTKDNLEENVSTFYAELLRINRLIQKVNDSKPTFFLLDEILRGTNSHDRLLGAKGLIRQLNQSNAFGLVSSHDVELAQLSDEIPGLINHSFHSSIAGNELMFDYKIRQGVCTNFNAVVLMQKMGITLDE